MDPRMHEWLNAAFRWLHVIAGVMWIGHLWFFNFVNAQLAKTYDADSKKKVVPELMPRALYFFRWGAAYTLITGIILFGLVYSMGGILAASPHGAGGGTALVLVVWVVGFLVYDLLWKAMAKSETAGAAVSFALFTAAAFGLSRTLDGRTVYITLGGLLGTIMASNVWMRIWPSQRKIIAGIKGTAPAAPPEVAALAGLRSKHNTYMSMPLMFFMVANHFPTIYGNDYGWAISAGFVAAGFGIAKFLYDKSAAAAPAQF